VRGLATYTLPKVDVLVSAIFRSQPNAQPGTGVATNGASRGATLPDDGGAVSSRNGCGGEDWIGDAGRERSAGGRAVRRPRERGGHALLEGPAA
jgi:hypothetical protein